MIVKCFLSNLKRDVILLGPFVLIGVLFLIACINDIIDSDSVIKFIGSIIILAGLFVVIHKSFQKGLYGNGEELKQVNLKTKDIVLSKIASVMICSSVSYFIALFIFHYGSLFHYSRRYGFHKGYLVPEIFMFSITLGMMMTLVMLFAAYISKKLKLQGQLVTEGFFFVVFSLLNWFVLLMVGGYIDYLIPDKKEPLFGMMNVSEGISNCYEYASKISIIPIIICIILTVVISRKYKLENN